MKSQHQSTPDQRMVSVYLLVSSLLFLTSVGFFVANAPNTHNTIGQQQDTTETTQSDFSPKTEKVIFFPDALPVFRSSH